MRGNYNAVAGFYDGLSRLVFGQAIYQAQLYLVKAIPAGARVLVAGGGTGWILELITRQHNSGLEITYVELSEKMIARSKKRNTGQNKVTFITKAIQQVPLVQSFDVIITPFLFDNFSESSLQQVFRQLHQGLRQQGLWLFSDFQYPEKNIHHRLLLKAMYLFFGMLCKLETNSLPDIAAQFGAGGYKLQKEALFFRGFICSRIYQKRDNAC